MPLMKNSVEDDFITTYKNSSKESVNSFLAVTQKKKWYKLHGLMCATHFPTKKAVQRQLGIDTKQSHLEALKLMATKLKGKNFVLAAVDIEDIRTLKIAGDCVNESPQIMTFLDVNKGGWQSVWMNVIAVGGVVWSGIKDKENIIRSS